MNIVYEINKHMATKSGEKILDLIQNCVHIIDNFSYLILVSLRNSFRRPKHFT